MTKKETSLSTIEAKVDSLWEAIKDTEEKMRTTPVDDSDYEEINTRAETAQESFDNFQAETITHSVFYAARETEIRTFPSVPESFTLHVPLSNRSQMILSILNKYRSFSTYGFKTYAVSIDDNLLYISTAFKGLKKFLANYPQLKVKDTNLEITQDFYKKRANHLKKVLSFINSHNKP